MNTPILLAVVTMFSGGISMFFRKVAGFNQVYSPSWMAMQSFAFLIATIVLHFAQKHPFELSPRLTGLSILSAIIGVVGVFSMLHAFKLGGEGSVLFPVAGLGVIVSVVLSFLVYREPVTPTKLLGLGLGVSSIIVLSR